jgi:hypothetical protein
MTDDERTLSVEQFCELEGLTEVEFWSLARSDGAPVILHIRCADERRIKRITPEAREKWHQRWRVVYAASATTEEFDEGWGYRWVEWDLDPPNNDQTS